MSARDPARRRDALEDFGAIPDPAARFALRPSEDAAPAAAPAERSPTRAERQRNAVAIGAVSLAWIAAIGAGFGPRADLGSAPVLGLIGLWSLAALTGLATTLRRGPRGLPRATRVVQGVLAALPIFYVASLLLRPSVPGFEVPFTARTVAPCAGISLAMAMGPIALGTLLLRRSFLTSPGWRGAAAGAACGMAAAVGIYVHCPIASMSHLLVAHGAVIVASAIAGGVIGVLRGRV